MTDLGAHLRALAESLPAGTVIPVPREWLLDLLGDEQAGQVALSDPPPADLTVADVAARFGRKRSTVRGWLDRGLIPEAYRFRGREWRVPLASLTTFEANQRGHRVATEAAPTSSARTTVDLGRWRSA